MRFFAALVIFGFIPMSYASNNASILLPEIRALALDKLVLDRANLPITVLETPTITDASGRVVQGLTQVTISLASDAKSSLMIQGKSLNPGETLTIAQDLTATDGVLKIPFYPTASNVVGKSSYSLDIPKITAEICPDTYSHDLATKTCQKVNTTNLLYNCPGNDWTLSGDVSKCTKQTEIPKVTCPAGFNSNGDGTCTKTEYEDTIVKCPLGYTYSLSNDQCEKTLVENAYKTCTDPSYSYQAATNDCRKTVNKTVDYKCAPTYSYNSVIKVCERTLVESGTPTCTAGYSYSATNKRCEKTISQTASKVCGSGFTYSAANDRCEKALTAAADPICISGYTFSASNSRCERTVSQTASKICSSGYSYSSANDRCERTLTQGASAVCASGYTYSAANSRCERTVSQTANKVCTSGYSYSSANDRCERTLTQGASAVCTGGYTYSAANSRCERTVSQTASKVCSSGYSYSSANDRCERTLTQGASAVCASGYTYSAANSRCERTDIQTANKVCSSGFTFNSSANRCEKMAFTGVTCSSGFTYSSSTDSCQMVVTTQAICAAGKIQGKDGYCYTNAGGDACFDLEYRNGVGSCEFMIQGNYCSCSNDSGGSNVRLSPICPGGSKGIDDYGRCGFTPGTAPNSCPSGYSYSNGACLKVTVSGASCPSGYSLNPGTDRCEKFETQAFSYSCPSGYSLNGSSCSKLQTVGNTWSCPSGYSLSGSTCSLVQAQAFTYSCPSGYSLSGSNCNLLQTAGNTWTCPSGYSLSGSTCSLFQVQEFSYSCPSGYSLSGSSCSQLQAAGNTWSCTSGYSLSGSTCSLLQAQAFTYSCPNGYSLSGSNCSQLQTTGNTWNCPSGYSLSGSTCHATDTRAFAYSCPSGYVNHNNGSCTQLLNTSNTWTCPASYANNNDGTCSWYQTASYSLACSDPAYAPNSTTEICERVLTNSHIFKCNDAKYTLNGSSCSLLLTAEEDWVCGDPSFSKTSETQCRKDTGSSLVGTCPAGFTKSADGSSCLHTDVTPIVKSCPSSFILKNGECVKDVYSAPICSTSIIDSSCTCSAGQTLNLTTYQCKGIDKSTIISSCPVGFYIKNGQCEYNKTVGVVYDFCPLGTVGKDGKCLLTQELGVTQSCDAPYTVFGTQCRYVDTKPVGYAIGLESKSYTGIIKTEESTIALKNSTFDAIVSEISELAIDDANGCKLVASELLAKGAVKKGDVPCFVSWTSLPEGIKGAENKVSGIFKKSGNQSLGYSLFGFNGTQLTKFEIAKGVINVNVNEPAKPKILDITTRLMSKVVTGFEMYNYSAASKLSFTTVLVEPRNYIQKVSVNGVGDCEVLTGANSCSVYSNVGYERDPQKLQYDTIYSILGNSKIGGWEEAELTGKDWVIHHDFRGPNVAFTQFNPTLSSDPIINTDLGFPVIVSGGQGAVGISNVRTELNDTDIWWKPSRVELEFTAQDGTQSSSMIKVGDINVHFDVPNSVSNTTMLSNRTVISEGLASAYPFEMKSLTPGLYTVKVTTKDAFNNESMVTYEDVEVSMPLPEIKVIHKKTSIEKLSGTQTVNMLDDLTVVAHNGVVGDTKITSIKIDGRDAITTNSDTYFKTLTSEGFDLEANSSYMLEVEAKDGKGRLVKLSMPFNHLQMTFGISNKPVSVIQKVEDVALTVNRTKGVRCDLYGTKAAAALASNDYNYACYIEWSELPEGLTPEVTTYQSKLSGAVEKLGTNTITYNAYIVNKSGRVGKVGGESITFEAIPPMPINIKLDDKQMLSEGVYSISINDRMLGRYTGQSSRAHIDVALSNGNGDKKQYKHNQLPFGETQNFSAYAEKLGDSELWDKIPYTLKANYRLAPELSVEKNFDLIVTPHPYMQVLMDLDSPKYASTDTIKATIKLGLRNNMNGQFEYSEATMGTGWDVYLAFKKGQTYERITESTQIGSNGTGVVELDGNIIFERNQPVYAVAKAQSPYPEISIQRVSVPRSITVVKGTAVDGKVVSRVVQSRIPAHFDVRFDTASFADFMVLGDIEWQLLDSTGNWVAHSNFDDLQYVSIKSTTPETIQIRASVTNKVTGVNTISDEVTLISYDVPQLKIDGASQAISGQIVELKALDHSDTPQPDAIVEWSLDNGETWLAGDHTYNLVVGESVLKVAARMKYANTSADVAAGQWSQAMKYISVTKPKPLSVIVNKPSIVEVGTEIELTLNISNPFVATGVKAMSEWSLPDGSVISDQKTIKYVVKQEDLDGSKRLNMKARAWLEGYKAVTMGESNIVINSFSYTFPTDSQLSLTVNNNIKFVPSTGFAILNMPYINAPGVKFTYDWTFDELAIKKTMSSGKSMNFTVIKAGVHKITLTLSDNRGNFTFIHGFVDAVKPDPLEFKVNDVYSNKYMRMPLTVSLYPSVKTSHPYDFMKTYEWTINGVKGEPSSRAIGVFENLPAGHYDVELDVTSNFGQVGKYTTSFDVKENKAPVCEPVVREQYGTHIVDANCKDSDGTISYYRWVVNGIVFSPYGAQVRFSEKDFPAATIVIEAIDDAGATGTGLANF
jgi:hypothetical protein